MTKLSFRYSQEKNEKIIKERGIGFEEIIQYMYEGNILAIRVHPNKAKYPNQKIIYVRVLKEVYSVPFITENDGTIYLKTLFPSRKARKEFSPL
jgi:uncharacterized DUF497 family protein